VLGEDFVKALGHHRKGTQKASTSAAPSAPESPYSD
jgi:hypothetical protein